ncbi:MAG: Holliday junction resolvase RuvX [Erysipelotrichaceae bacterium]|nr:Holliday junction resolvase RuvX [Erysipelotrichaceae bacterium]MBQ9986833.1 Holliday junction resolvase RuvX [Erysipelotrichales bacterium]MBR3694356.1 Holliday junction resolvase RuvX [Erysipelotrichales bacterium]
MRVMGLDLGSRTCGVAVSDALCMVARPLETIRFPDEKNDIALERIVELIKEHEVHLLVLGLPKHMNGDIGIRAEISIKFKEKLESRTGLRVVLIDERMTTMQASRILISADVSRSKRKKVIDQMAAVTILQGFLDSSMSKAA